MSGLHERSIRRGAIGVAIARSRGLWARKLREGVTMIAVRKFARWVVLGSVLVSVGPVSGERQSGQAAGQNGPTLVRLPPEVRLRKLHLVRPDLIPYPIAYEVCC
jgi:hypothetical protein